jgi:hypothetical protein
MCAGERKNLGVAMRHSEMVATDDATFFISGTNFSMSGSSRRLTRLE